MILNTICNKIIIIILKNKKNINFRKDDLESICYVAIHLMKNLPWIDIKTNDINYKEEILKSK